MQKAAVEPNFRYGHRRSAIAPKLAIVLLLAVGALTGRAHADASFTAQPQVIGGEAAEPGAFPWLAFVRGGTGICTGSVVSSSLILTAAHCVVDPDSGATRDPADYVVVTGNVDWTEAPREMSAVAQILVNPVYEPGGVRNRWDAALLHLSRPIQAPPIRFAETKIWNEGTVALIAGWGVTQFEQEDATEHLQWAPTIVQSDQYCLLNAPGFLPGIQLCAIEASGFESGACHGDSGGPLLAQAPSRQELMLIGVTKGAYGACRTDLPNLFTRSDSISAWINGRIKALNPPLPRVTPPPPSRVSPAASPRTPTLGQLQAAAFSRQVLRRVFRKRYLAGRTFKTKCNRNLMRNRQRCDVSWIHGSYVYEGWVQVTAQLHEGSRRLRAQYSIRWMNALCQTKPARVRMLRVYCGTRTKRGSIAEPFVKA